MNLTEREKEILRLKKRGYSDYRIARMLKVNVVNVYRSRQNALRKIKRAKADLAFAQQIGVEVD